MFVARCTPVGGEAIARLRSRTVADARAVDGRSPAGAAASRRRHLVARAGQPHRWAGRRTPWARRRAATGRTRSSRARRTQAPPTWSRRRPRRTLHGTSSRGIFVPYRPESARSAATTYVDVPAFHAGLRALAELATKRDEARRVVVGHDEQIRSTVAHLRINGVSWGQIGAALGISRQGARQRFDPAARAAHSSRPIYVRSTDLADDVPPAAGRRTPAVDEQEDSRWTSWRP